MGEVTGVYARRLAVAAAMLAGVWAGPAPAITVGSSWITDYAVGNWNNEDHWNGPEGAKIPYNRTFGNTYYSYFAVIPPDPLLGLLGGIKVGLDLNSVTLGRLTLGANTTLTVPGATPLGAGVSLAIERRAGELGSGVLHNDGTIILAAVGGPSRLGLVTDNTDETQTIEGTGTIRLWGGQHLQSELWGYRMLHESGHTIEGTGKVKPNIVLTNQGVIRAAEFDTLEVVLPAAGVGLRNQHVVEASEGGLLRLSGGTVDNRGGTIRARAGSVVELSGTAVRGGVVTTSGSGVVQSKSASLLGTTRNAGTLVVPNGGLLWLRKDEAAIGGDLIENDGSIELRSTGALTTLTVRESLKLEGSGLLWLGDNDQNRVRGWLGTEVLTNGPDHTIVGSGALGAGNLGLKNEGTVRANQARPLVVAPNSWGTQNEGLMEADGGTLRLVGSTFWNSGGVIRHRNGATVELMGTRVVGGTLAGSGTGAFRIADYSHAFLDNLTLATRLVVPSGTTAYLRAGTLTNDGLLSLEGGASAAMLRLSLGDVTLAGSGILAMSNSANNYLLGTGYSGDTPKHLTHGAGHTIQGSGQLSLALTNHGMIRANQTVPLVVDPGAGGLWNHGTLRAEAGSTLTVTNTLKNYDAASGVLSGGRYSAAGTLRLANADILSNAAWIDLEGPTSALLRHAGGANALAGLGSNQAAGIFRVVGGRHFQSAGSFINAGEVEVGAASLFTVGPSGSGNYLQTAGVTAGSGTLKAAAVNVLGGVFSPGTSPGTLTVDGDFLLGPNGTLRFEIGGLDPGQHDRLVVTGNAVLEGTLTVDLYSGFNPVSAFSVDLLLAGSLGMQLSSVVLPAAIQGLFTLGHDAGGLRLGYTPAAPIPAPAAGLLLASGLGAAALLRRRRASGAGDAGPGNAGLTS